MSQQRWENELFAASVDVRNQENQPAQLTLVRRGVYVGSGRPLAESLPTIHTQHSGLNSPSGGVDAFEREVASFVRTVSPSPPVDVLSASQMEAIRAYTLQQPAYFRELNRLLYTSQNAVHDAALNAWQDFLFHLDTGLTKLREYARDHGSPSGKLFRFCWIPTDILRHFEQGRDVVFKAPCSASPHELESFYFDASAEETAGKHAVLLEFDNAASAQAADIHFLSRFPAEEEWLFPPYFRAQVVEEYRLLQFVSGRCPRDDLPVHHFRLSCKQRFEPLPAVLDWCGGISVSQLLELALILDTHQANPTFRQVLLKMESLMRDAVSLKDDFYFANYLHYLCGATGIVCTLPALCLAVPLSFLGGIGEVMLGLIGVNLSYEARKVAQNILMSPALVLGLPGSIIIVGAMLHAKALHARAQQTTSSELQATADQWTAKLEVIREQLEEELRTDFRKVLEQLQRHLPGYSALLATVMQGCCEPTSLIKNMASMLIEVQFIGHVLSGHPQTLAALETPFPLAPESLGRPCWLPLSSQLAPYYTQFRVGDKTEQVASLHPVLAAIQAGNDLCSGVQVDSEHAKAMSVLASLDLLRLRLCRTRVVLPLGLTDTGKSSVLNCAFGLALPTGLSEDGRTKALTFHADAQMPDLLIGDTPGFADSVEGLDDTVQIGLGLTYIPGLAVVLLVMMSGRNNKTQLDELVRILNDGHVPIIVVITHADVRFLNLSQQTRPSSVTKRAWWHQKAEEIKAEDAQRLTRLLPGASTPIYTCCAGPFSVGDQSNDEDGPDVFVSQQMKDAFHHEFKGVLMDADALRKHVLASFRLTSSGRP